MSRLNVVHLWSCVPILKGRQLRIHCIDSKLVFAHKNEYQSPE